MVKAIRCRPSRPGLTVLAGFVGALLLAPPPAAARDDDHRRRGRHVHSARHHDHDRHHHHRHHRHDHHGKRKRGDWRASRYAPAYYYAPPPRHDRPVPWHAAPARYYCRPCGHWYHHRDAFYGHVHHHHHVAHTVIPLILIATAAGLIFGG